VTTRFSDLLAELEAPPPPPPAPPEGSRLVACTAALESIGHLQKKIESMWGSPQLDGFISSLFVDSRDGARKGLPMELAGELAFLADLNKMLRAVEMAERLNLSVREAYRLVDEGDQARGTPPAQSPMQKPPATVFAARRVEPNDGSLTGGMLTIVLIVAAIGGILIWLWASGSLAVR